MSLFNTPQNDTQEAPWLHKIVLFFGVDTWKSNEEQGDNTYVLLVVTDLSQSTVWTLWHPLFLASFYVSPLYLSKLAVMKGLVSAHSYTEVPPCPFVPAALNISPNCSACVGWHCWSWCYRENDISEHAIQFLKAIFWKAEGKIYV